ncbi:copper amine oxidase [Aspergillus leporis]|uniref:Amine oxidase n=1 Tax=Aspergillus leporis TaxID=41062 RepID=A0A5N5X8W6_9EURO|nr:copper amine oxidase [Aspergillus leporis]
MSLHSLDPTTPQEIQQATDLFVHDAELPRDFHGPVDRAEMNDAVQAVMADPRAKEEIKRLKIDNTTVALDPWDYGVHGKETQTRRTQVGDIVLAFLYMRNPENNDPDSNHYCFPLGFMVIFNLSEIKVEKIIRLPLGFGIRPEGASFTVKGHLIEWEKRRFRMALHDVPFDGKSAFYRLSLSLSEMFVPYGDPRNPIYRKGAFDLGNVGAGVTANNLQLGCDCLGMIKYLDGCVVAQNVSPAPRPNVIHIHEIDNGIQWKHPNDRTGKSVVVRKHQLVLQTYIAVANYEYIFMWYFDHSDEVMAPYHQHLFNLHIDPAVGGHRNSFAFTDSASMPYVTEQTILDLAGPVEDEIAKGRAFQNLERERRNPVSLTPIGYKLAPGRSQSREMVRNIVFWHTFGFTHNLRVEDFAVVPAKIAQVWLVPYNFYLYNLTNDVPPSNQEFNRSTEYKAPEGSQSPGSSGCSGSCRSHL